MANHEPPPLQRKRVPPQIGRLSIYFSKESVGTPTDSGEKTPPFRPISLFFTKFHYFSLFWVLSLGLQRTARIVLKPLVSQGVNPSSSGRICAYNASMLKHELHKGFTHFRGHRSTKITFPHANIDTFADLCPQKFVFSSCLIVEILACLTRCVGFSWAQP